MTRAIRRAAFVLLLACVPASTGAVQVDSTRAQQYFQEAAALCAREAGALWRVSLCGPIVIYDAASRTIATNQPAPDAARPAVLGYANAAMDWGGTRWTTLVWALISPDTHLRAQLLVHELFHRVQPQRGLLGPEGTNEHLDTLDGRYYLQLEWRALARALGTRGPERDTALADALAFRQTRRSLFPPAAEHERRMEINEGLAQYTATVVTSASLQDAEQDAIYQMQNAALYSTFIRTFPYGMGAAYGLLLDSYAPGWRDRIRVSDDLGTLVAASAKVTATGDAGAAARRYGGTELRTYEERRDGEQKERVAELRRRYVDGPVLVLPPATSSAYMTNGMTPVPGLGTLFPHFRGSGDWGTVDAAFALVREADHAVLLAAPTSTTARTVTGDGWTVALAEHWKTSDGPRAGDLHVEREKH